MKKIALTLTLMALILSAAIVKAQFNPFTDKTNMITAGFGITGWGIPIFARDLSVNPSTKNDSTNGLKGL